MPADRTEHTIAAISTPPGSGGIGIIRISGAQALAILQRLFRPHDRGCRFRSHQLYYGHIVQPGADRIVDEVLAVYMQAPRTYTREDVVEIHCHGSYLLLSRILELILAAGVRLADPGEFTKRAFLNGRIDLTRAEAVIDILAAKTRKGIDQAQAQLAGALYQRIEGIRQGLMQMKAYIEVAIDFPDEDAEIVDLGGLQQILQQQVAAPLQRLIASADQGRILRDGISVVIAGVPNVGKSSLLNALLQEERALVTAIPGTTRDFIEEYLDIEGIPVRIIDTAGIRDHAEEVEELGIKRAKVLLQQADLVLFMVDGSRDLSEADLRLHRLVAAKPLIVVINKSDLCQDGVRDFAAQGITGAGGADFGPAPDRDRGTEAGDLRRRRRRPRPVAGGRLCPQPAPPPGPAPGRGRLPSHRRITGGRQQLRPDRRRYPGMPGAAGGDRRPHHRR